MLLLREPDYQTILGLSDAPELVRLVEEVHRHKAARKASVRNRLTVEYPQDEGYYSDLCLRSLWGIAPEMNASGAWLYSTFHADKVVERGPRALDYNRGSRMFLLFACRPAHELIAIMSHRTMGYARTGAASGVATKFMSREDSHVLGVVGAGHLAIWQIAAACAVRPIEKIRIYSPTAANREGVARRAREELKLDCVAVGSAREAVTDADVVITATSANRPVIETGWLKPGAHVNIVARGECGIDTIQSARWIACSLRSQILDDTPPFLPIPEVLAKGIRNEGDFQELDDFVVDSGFLKGRGSKDMTLFLSQGIGLWDVATGRWAYDRAVARGLGQDISF